MRYEKVINTNELQLVAENVRPYYVSTRANPVCNPRLRGPQAVQTLLGQYLPSDKFDEVRAMVDPSPCQPQVTENDDDVIFLYACPEVDFDITPSFDAHTTLIITKERS